ncbi:MAG: DUF4783 domain-containing protein [Bacteroidales bacterium]|jgi:hypothetical protein
MKRFATILILITVTTTLMASFIISNTSEIISDIEKAIQSGNAANVSIYFNSTIDITVPKNEGTFSKTQAEMIIKDFFTKNPVKSFSINHKGTSNDGSKYGIGTYTSTSSISFRTYFLLKKADKNFLIQKLEFDDQQ